jgi:hypothetical protein
MERRLTTPLHPHSNILATVMERIRLTLSIEDERLNKAFVGGYDFDAA